MGVRPSHLPQGRTQQSGPEPSPGHLEGALLLAWLCGLLGWVSPAPRAPAPQLGGASLPASTYG